MRVGGHEGSQISSWAPWATEVWIPFGDHPLKLGTYTAHVGDQAGAESTSCDQAAHFSISDSGQAGEMRVWPGVRLARGHPGRLKFGFPSGIIR